MTNRGKLPWGVIKKFTYGEVFVRLGMPENKNMIQYKIFQKNQIYPKIKCAQKSNMFQIQICSKIKCFQ